MNIRNLRCLSAPPTARGFTALARFSVESVPGFLAYDLQLVRAPSGKLLVYGPPSRNGSPVINLAPEVRAEIASVAFSQLQDAQHHECQRRS
jgi:hypothetical protein